MGLSDSYKLSPTGSVKSSDKGSSISNASFRHKGVDDSASRTEDEEVHGLGHFDNAHGVHWVVAAILIVGEMAGGGLVTLPSSVVDSGIYAGIALTLISAVASGYTGVQLGDNWLMMQDRWPEYRHACRKPYPEMASRAVGRWGSVFMGILIGAQQFGLAVVFLILGSQNISSFLNAFWDVNLNFCFVVLILAAFLFPLLLLGSPKDFWQAALIAMISTSIAVILIIIGAAHDQDKCAPQVNYPGVKFNKFFLAYGTIMFAYGGHSAFPTFQHDMRKPYEFKKSVILGYIIIVLMYLPVSVYGYVVYGDSLEGSIIPSLQLTWTQQAVNVLITIHVTFTQMIIISPLSQGVEDLLGVSIGFSLKRVAVRGVILICIVFVALSIPDFGAILDVIGGTTITLMTMLLPPIYYMWLTAGGKRREARVHSGEVSHQDPDNEIASFAEVFKYNNKWILLVNALILAFGLIGGVASTISAVDELINQTWSTPCYVAVFQGGFNLTQSGGTVNCCGGNKDIITIAGKTFEDFCAAASSN